MPKHIVAGLKYLAAIELRKRGYTQREIAGKLDMDRSTVSHYLNGRNLSWNSIEIAEAITGLCSKDFALLTYALIKDKEKTRTIVKVCSNNKFDVQVKNSCIGCGICVDTCFMNAIVLNDLKAQINNDWCCGCMLCEENCPTHSIEIKEVDDDGDYRNY